MSSSVSSAVIRNNFISGILEPNAIVGIKFRGDKLLALQKRNDELMQQLDTKLIEEIKVRFPSSHFIRCPHVKVVFQLRGVDSPEANHTRNLIAKRSEDLKKAYRGVIVELADLHDRPERMALKKAVQVRAVHLFVFLSPMSDLFIAARR